ncbi:MAG: hypothetical protein ABSC48_05350 [Terracidiphilus sp.]
MADSANPIQGRRAKPPALVPQTKGRAWSLDDIVVVVFAFFGFGCAVFLPLRFDNIPPITISFLLATGLAALTYRFLGGIEGASFAVGTLKLGGALAALVGIAMLINHTLVSQVRPPAPPYQVWVVSGQVTDESGQPIEPLDVTDIALQPPLLVPYPGGRFKLNIYSWPDVNGKMAFPVISVSHNGFSSHPVDLNPDAQNDVDVERAGQTITLKQIKLSRPPAEYNPPQQALQKVADASKTMPAPTEAQQ